MSMVQAIMASFSIAHVSPSRAVMLYMSQTIMETIKRSFGAAPLCAAFDLKFITKYITKNMTSCLLYQNFFEKRYCVLHPTGEYPKLLTMNIIMIVNALKSGAAVSTMLCAHLSPSSVLISTLFAVIMEGDMAFADRQFNSDIL